MNKITSIEISPIEVSALKKLVVINGALAKQLTGRAAHEQVALLRVLIGIVNRAELANAMEGA
ncbi:hypothetical protein HJB79_32070 [Rhizobium lentis]|uniref:hypothetical protein n=1 Tax=Rhizobium lentis TaxID=1138194 RepID=UPI001C83223B|nr:hypothetical protein [Rhizobium lentis]MBX5143336.1 hypothetical protein [Rhizobium lentis]